MKKSMSILLALAMVLSLLPAYARTSVTAVSTEPVKAVSAEIVLPGDSTPTTLSAFVFEDFESYSVGSYFDAADTGYDDGYIVPYSTAYTAAQKPEIVSTAGDMESGNALKFNGTSGANTENDYTINPAFWAEGNKITGISFDVQNVKGSQIRFWWVWASSLDDGKTASTSTTTGVLGHGFLPSGSGSETKSTFMVRKDAANSQEGANVPVFCKEGGDLQTDGTLDGHYDIRISYEVLSETQIKVVSTFKAWPYSAEGDYTADSYLTKTLTSTVTCPDVDALTLVPVISPSVNYKAITLDNLAIESVDSEAIRFMNAHGATLAADSHDDTQAWDAAADAWNALSGLAKEKLASYSEQVEAYAEVKAENDLVTAGKLVKGKVILPGNDTATTLKAFLFEDFEGYDHADPEKTVIHSLTGYTTSSVPTLTAYASLGGSTVLKMPEATESFNITDNSNAFSAAQSYWADGNKVTKLSFDVATLGMMNRINLYWGYARELASSATATFLSPQLTSYNSTVQFSTTAKQSDNTAGNITGNFSNVDVFHNDGAQTKVTAVHMELEMSYEYLTEKSVKMVTVIRFYPFDASGSYTDPADTRTCTVTYDWSATDIQTTAAELTILPNFHTETSELYYDNIRMESVDGDAIAYVNTYAGVFAEGSQAGPDDWKAAATAYNELPTIVKDRLVVYGDKINDYYANAEKVVTSDFTDAFTDSMFWSNYDNLTVEGGKVTGVKENAVSYADGQLVKDKALSAVQVKGIQSNGHSAYQGYQSQTILYPLFAKAENGAEAIMGIFLFTEENKTVVRVLPHGNMETWTNMTYESYSAQNLIVTETVEDLLDLTVYYDWSKYDAANNYQVTLLFVAGYTHSVNGYTTASSKVVVTFGSRSGDQVTHDVSAFGGNVPGAEDFVFGFRNPSQLDSVSVGTVDETAGQVLKTGMFYDKDNADNGFNGALTFKVQNSVMGEEPSGAEVLDYGVLFISKGSLGEGELTLNTPAIQKLDKETITGAGVALNGTYNVRISGTQAEDWAGQKIVARTYTTYKLGGSQFTVYGDVLIKSNYASWAELANKHNSPVPNGSTHAQALAHMKALAAAN